ncbi:MAG TPA: hypothetical protein VHX65_17145 [Pirellulales bacterium]|jgi:hypothetical protein|nr:hypothetical protein [Pirellulales bacterium]
MSRKSLWGAGLLFAMVALTNTGCFWITELGPNLGAFSIPIPVSPYFQDAQEQRFIWNEKYKKAPILGPIAPGAPDVGVDTPSDDEVMRSLERVRPVRGGFPLLYERSRNNVRIVKDKIADYIDPPRVYPLIGPAQLHHVHYKCTIYFQEITRVGWPLPYTTSADDAQEVVYIDHDHLHMVGKVNTGASANF